MDDHAHASDGSAATSQSDWSTQRMGSVPRTQAAEAAGEARRADFQRLRQWLDLDRNDVADVDQRGPDADRNGVDDRTQVGPDRNANEVDDLLDAALAQLAAMQLDPVEAALAPRPGLDVGAEVDFAAVPEPGVDIGP